MLIRPAFFATLALASSLWSRDAAAEPPAGYQLAWADEFNDAQLDPAKWNHWLPGVRRAALNVPEAVTLKDGFLTITTYTEGGKHFTGMIATKGLFEGQYGYWEARLEWHEAAGAWSAFWLQTPTIGHPIGDVAAAGMEIDVCEHRSVDPDGKDISNTINHTLHWDGYGPAHKGTGFATPKMGLATGFHVYGFEWTETEYRFFVDGKQTWTCSKAISKRPQFVILSTEVGTKEWAGPAPAEGYGDRTQSTTKLTVDYVRYYKKP